MRRQPAVARLRGPRRPGTPEISISRTDLIPTNNEPFLGGPYQVTESAALGTDLTGYEASWECQNVDPDACSADAIKFVDDPFTLGACAPIQPLGCGTVAGFVGGVMTGTGFATPDFSICQGAHVICKFTNEGGDDVCLESANALGDLQVSCGVQVQAENVASPRRRSRCPADSADSIFLASFTPIADQSHWPGTVDHFVQPLPVVENERRQATWCPTRARSAPTTTTPAAWPGTPASEILTQAPDAAEVATDRRIGMGADERRVTYTQGCRRRRGAAHDPRLRLRDSDAIADERDLWTGMGISFIAGDPTRRASPALDGAQRDPRDARGSAASPSPTPTPERDETLDLRRRRLLPRRADRARRPVQLLLPGQRSRGQRPRLQRHHRLRTRATAASSRSSGAGARSCSRRRTTGSSTPSTPASSTATVDGQTADRRVHARHRQASCSRTCRGRCSSTRATMVTEDHDFGIDGALVVDDVFIDPAHNGTPDRDRPASGARWCSAATARAGAGVFALDLTQPDPVEPRNVVNFAGQPDVEYIPAAAPATSRAARRSAAPAGRLRAALPGACSGSSTTPALSRSSTGRPVVAVRRRRQRQARPRLLVVEGQHRPRPGRSPPARPRRW